MPSICRGMLWGILLAIPMSVMLAMVVWWVVHA